MQDFITEFTASLKSLTKRERVELLAATSLSALGLMACSFMSGVADVAARLSSANYAATTTANLQGTLEAPGYQANSELDRLPESSVHSATMLVFASDTSTARFQCSGNLVKSEKIGDQVLASFITAGHCLDSAQVLGQFHVTFSTPQLSYNPSVDVEFPAISIAKAMKLPPGQRAIAREDLGIVSVLMPEWAFTSLNLTPITKFASPEELASEPSVAALSFPSMATDLGHDYHVLSGNLQYDDYRSDYVVEANAQQIGGVTAVGGSGSGVFTANDAYTGPVSANHMDRANAIVIAYRSEAEILNLVAQAEHPLKQLSLQANQQNQP